MRRKRAVWERAVADVEAGVSQSEAARRHGVSQPGLSYWVRKFREIRARPADPQLLPVRVTSVVAPAVVAPSRYGLLVRDLRLEFDEGADPSYVAAIAKALRSC